MFLLRAHEIFIQGCPYEQAGQSLYPQSEIPRTHGILAHHGARTPRPDRTTGHQLMDEVITAVSAGVPAALEEITTLGRALKKRAADVLACFDRPGTSNGSTEAINGRFEHLRGSALGFRDLAHYVT